jgi:hypothetical protein
MSCPSNTRALAAALAVSCALSGCSDIYFDRRETIAPSAGDAKQINQVTMMVDPWPPASAERNIAFNGIVMGRAAARYRTGRVIPPCNPVTSTVVGAKCVAASTQDGPAQSNYIMEGSNNNTAAQQQAPSTWAGPQRSQSQAQAQQQP